MNLSDLFASDVDDILLDADQLAETWTYRPLGASGSDEPRTVFPESPEETRETDDGRRVCHKRKVWVKAAAAYATADRWQAPSGTFYETLAVGEPEAGLQRLSLQSVDDETVSGSRTIL